MKTNAQQIEAIAKLAKPFDAIQTANFLAREIVGYNKSSDKLVDLQKQIDDAKNEKGARKKAIDGLLKELWTNNVTMIEGKGVTKCPIRVALKEVLSKEGLSDKTVSNICGAVSYALNNKKPYDIKYLEKKAQQKKIDDAKKEGTTPPASGTTPPASGTTPPASGTTPPASGTTPPASGTTPPTTKKNTRLDYCKDASAVIRQLFDATQFRKCLNDSDSAYYDEIIENIKNITTILATMAKDKDYTPNTDDNFDDDNFDDDDLGIDSELVD